MMQRKRVITILGLLLVAVASWGLDLQIILDAAQLSKAEAPRRYGDRLLMTYQFADTDDQKLHTVGASFEHDHFQTLHQFQRNEQGVYVLLYTPPIESRELLYRLVVDGIWTTDPSNSETVTDRWGVRLSTIDIPPVHRSVVATPIVHPNGNVEFLLDATPGSRVVVVGDFNGWDPYATPLTESEPGVFTRTVRVGAGEHLYYFWVNGVRYPDPRNPEQRWHTAGMALSAVQVP